MSATPGPTKKTRLGIVPPKQDPKREADLLRALQPLEAELLGALLTREADPERDAERSGLLDGIPTDLFLYPQHREIARALVEYRAETANGRLPSATQLLAWGSAAGYELDSSALAESLDSYCSLDDAIAARWQLLAQYKKRRARDIHWRAAARIDAGEEAADISADVRRLLDDLEAVTSQDGPARLIDEPADELLASEIEMPASLIGDGLLPRGGTATMFGPRGAGKSWLVMRLALAVARSEPWLDLPTTPGQVGIMSFEMPRWALQARLRKLVTEELKGDQRGLDRIYFLGRERLVGLKLPDAGWVILRWVRSRELSLLCVDPLRRVLTGAETSEVLTPVLDEFERIAVKGNVAILTAHHTRKSGKEGKRELDPLDAARGASELVDYVDACLYLERCGDLRRLSFPKVRHAAEPEEIWLSATGQVVPAPAAAKDQVQENFKRIRRHLRADPTKSYTAEDLVDTLDLTSAQGRPLKPATVRTRYMAKLIDQGLVAVVPGGGPKDPKRYRWVGPDGPEPEEEAEML